VRVRGRLIWEFCTNLKLLYGSRDITIELVSWFVV